MIGMSDQQILEHLKEMCPLTIESQLLEIDGIYACQSRSMHFGTLLQIRITTSCKAFNASTHD